MTPPVPRVAESGAEWFAVARTLVDEVLDEQEVPS